jgi:hypothetical protein
MYNIYIWNRIDLTAYKIEKDQISINGKIQN